MSGPETISIGGDAILILLAIIFVAMMSAGR